VLINPQRYIQSLSVKISNDEQFHAFFMYRKGIKIGNVIEQQFNESGMTKTAFAQKLGYERNNIYNIFEKESINSELLYNISIVLHFDFFQIYSHELKKEIVSKIDT